MKAIRILALLALLGGTGASNAERFWGEDGLHLIPYFHVRVVDGAVGGCWTNMSSVKTAVELILRQSGLMVTDKGDLNFTGHVIITVNSDRLNEKRCYGSVNLSVVTLGDVDILDDSIVYPFSLYEKGFIFAKSGNANKQVMEYAEDFARDIANKILKQRAEHGK